MFNQTTKTLKIFLFSLFFILCFSFCSSVFAAKIFFDSEIKYPKLDEVFQIDVYLNTQNQEINGLEGKIIFSKDKLNLQEIKVVDSAVNLWFDQPHLNIHQDYQEVMFGGIIPGSYNEERGLILSLIFRAIDNGEVALSFKDLKGSLGDGSGTEIEITSLPLSLFISSGGLNIIEKKPEIIDNIPPEEFYPTISQSQDIFDNQWFVVFSTEDKQSGIDHYEIAEKRDNEVLNYIDDLNWRIAVNPQILNDQKLKSYVYIKAVDKAGNRRIIPLYPINSWFWYEKPIIWVIIIIIISLVVILIKILCQKRLKLRNNI